MSQQILELKEKQSVQVHLQFLQDIINRMANNSSNVKALTGVVYTILVTVLITAQKIQQFWWLGLIIAVIGLLLDSYYLAFERMYRKKYNSFVDSLNKNKLDEKEIFNLKPKNTQLKYEVFAEMLENINSFSIVPYYFLFIGLSIILRFM